MEFVKLFSYNGNNITFKKENGIVYVNATEMAKPFGKTPKNYLRTNQAQELIEAISIRLKCLTTDLVLVMQGGNMQGILMHEDIALDFAQMLSVDFRLWCNDKLKELLTTAQTNIQPVSQIDILLQLQSVQILKQQEQRVRLPSEFVYKIFGEMKTNSHRTLNYKSKEVEISGDPDDVRDLVKFRYNFKIKWYLIASVISILMAFIRYIFVHFR